MDNLLEELTGLKKTHDLSSLVYYKAHVQPRNSQIADAEAKAPGGGGEAQRSHAISGTLPIQYQHVFSNPEALPTPPFRLLVEAGLTKSLVTNSISSPSPPTPRPGAGLKAPTLTLPGLSGYRPPSLSQPGGAHSHLISIQKTLSLGRSHKVLDLCRYPATKTKYFLTMPRGYIPKRNKNRCTLNRGHKCPQERHSQKAETRTRPLTVKGKAHVAYSHGGLL